MVEYALIVTLVALVAIAGWTLFGTAVSNLANNF
jgi:Flp pilus assembly pilin Flp